MAQRSFAASWLETAKAKGIAGVLTVNARGFKWAANVPGAASPLNVDFRTIKGQRASKEATSKKALLNLLTDSTVQYFFEFVNFAERDSCRDFIASNLLRDGQSGTPQAPASLPQPASNSSKPPQSEQINRTEIERRCRLLNENKELKALHHQLVLTKKVLSEAEFWASRKHLLRQTEKQRTGWGNVMLADIQATSDGRANRVQYNLTPEIIHQIFVEKPAVHKAFLSCVPSRMTEQEFWTKYCKAEHNLRESDAAARAEADIDEDLAVFVYDDQIIAKELSQKIKKVDPTLDMASDDADYVSLPGHGIFRDGTKEADALKSKNKLTRLINRHADVVLAGRHNLEVEPSAPTLVVAQALAKAQHESTPMEVDDDPKARSERVHSMTELEDLQGSRGPDFVPLSIQDPRKYFDVQSLNAGGSSSSFQEPSTALDCFRKQIKTSQLPSLELPRSAAAGILSNLTQIISTAKHPLGKTAEKNVLDVLPASIRDVILQHSATISELLRHYWACFPITSPTLERKAARLKEVMGKLYNDIEDMKKSLKPEHRHHVSLIVQPMLQTIDAAFAHEANAKQQQQQDNGSDHVNGTN